MPTPYLKQVLDSTRAGSGSSTLPPCGTANHHTSTTTRDKYFDGKHAKNNPERRFVFVVLKAATDWRMALVAAARQTMHGGKNETLTAYGAASYLATFATVLSCNKTTAIGAAMKYSRLEETTTDVGL